MLFRRRKPVKPFNGPIILPGVIEIKPDNEAAERNELRARAAEAIGVTLEDEQVNDEEQPSLPPFPATMGSLNIQLESSVLKYYPPSSLRLFALAKHWKSRYLVLSLSHLHLFKSNSPDEYELERLEITDESVVFVADQDIAGKRHVVKVGGQDLNWSLHLQDPQLWITTIKNAIFQRKSIRAGLDAHSNNFVEPTGDMDVMLSIRAQQNHKTASVKSLSMSSTIKGLFTGRPRSSSRSTTEETEPAVPPTKNREDSWTLSPPPRKRWTADISHHRANTEPPSSPSSGLDGFSFDSPEQKPRAPSTSSVSTLNSKRWSHQNLPQRPAPPSGPPPAIPRPHPYAAGDQPPTRQSSTSSRRSTLPSFSKRASGGSAFSVNSASTRSSHRISMPPPRPAPTSALPPAPDHRRLSLMAPKRPTSIVLPSRADGIKRQSVPSSPFPPPEGPLPPTPPSRHTSFKHRLRMLSAPSPTTPTTAAISSAITNTTNGTLTSTTSPPGTPTIAEKIIDLSNDSFLQMPSPTTPRPPTPKLLRSSLVVQDDILPELSLSPPPRRPSKQLALSESRAHDDALGRLDEATDDTNTPPHESESETEAESTTPPKSLTPDTTPLSHQTSLISLGIATI